MIHVLSFTFSATCFNNNIIPLHVYVAIIIIYVVVVVLVHI